jgi:Abortive infection C-terminus
LGVIDSEHLLAVELISKKARIEFREYFVGTSLREIETEFDSADVPFDPNYVPALSGQRRSLVEQYYHAVDWSRWSDVRKVLTVYENVLASLEDQAENGQEWAEKCFKSLKKWIERDGFRYENGKLNPVGKHHGLEHIADAVGSFDLPELHRQILRMQSAVEDDPGLAIGTAKELVESVCKTILEQRQIAFADDADVGQLVKEVRKALGLIPESIPNSAKGAESIRRLLSNLGNVAQGLGELRNLHGTGHGKGGAVKGLSPRHARLAVGTAATLSTFLFETHIERGI